MDRIEERWQGEGVGSVGGRRVIREGTQRWRGSKYITCIQMKVAQWNTPKTVWKVGREGKGVLREYNRGGELVQSMLYTFMKFAQWNPLHYYWETKFCFSELSGFFAQIFSICGYTNH
jgi:hypothetical protein